MNQSSCPLNIDVIFLCLEQNKIVFAQTSEEEMEKTFNIEQQQNNVRKISEAKIFKEYLKGEVNSLEEFK